MKKFISFLCIFNLIIACQNDVAEEIIVQQQNEPKDIIVPPQEAPKDTVSLPQDNLNDSFLFLIEKYVIEEKEHISFNYNEENEVINKNYHSPGIINWETEKKDSVTVEYNYSGGRDFTSYERNNHVDDFSFVGYLQENNKLIKVNTTNGFHDTWHNDFVFDTQMPTYSHTYWYEYVSDSTIAEYKNSYKLNDKEQLIELRRENITNAVIDTLTFMYDKDNLTKIMDSDGSLWEIEYDNNPNFHTYMSSFASAYWDSIFAYGISDSSGLLFLDNELFEILLTIPQLYNHFNTNNPLIYKKNGQIYQTFQYQYNSYDYPISITLQSNQKTIYLEYYQIAQE